MVVAVDQKGVCGTLVQYSFIYGKILQQNMGTSTLALGGLGKSMINFAVTWCMQ